MVIYKVGDLVRVSPDNDNENYTSFRKKILKIVDVDKEFDKEGFLYSFKDLKGKEIDFSLYDWELISIKRGKKH